MLKDKIKELCVRNGTTIQKLEETLNIGNGVISRWDKSSPKADNLKKVADYFGVTLDYLMSDEEPKTKIDFQLFGDKTSEENQRDEVKMKLEKLYDNMSEEDKKTAIAILEAIAAKGKK